MTTHYHTTFNPIIKRDGPPHTEELVLHDDFNNLIYDLPSCIKFIKFGKLFNKPITNIFGNKAKCYLHNNIIAIKFGECYNQISDNLPKFLYSLTFGWFFNQPITTLPIKLEYLELGFNFNQKLDDLPSNLRYLTLGFNFNKSLDVIPDSIIRLTIFNNNEQLLNNIPQFIQELELNDAITNKKIDNFPFCLQKLILRNYKKENKYKLDKIPFGCKIVYT